MGYHEDAVAVLVMRQDFPRSSSMSGPGPGRTIRRPGREVFKIRRIDRFQFAWRTGRDFLIRMAFPDAEIGFLQFIVSDDIQMMRRGDIRPSPWRAGASLL